MRRMQGMDTTFFQAETPTMHLHVVGVLVLDPSTGSGPWGYDTVLALMEERMHLLPPFRWRAVTVPGDVDQPRWIEDPDFDLRRQVHRATLDPPADLDSLARFTGEVAGVPLDRSRPLWEMHVVEGMAGGSVALVTKLHHAYMDGGAGSEVMASMFDLTAEGEPVEPPEQPWEADEEPNPIRLLAESAGGAVSRAARLPGMLVGTAKAVVDSAQAVRGRRVDSGVPIGPSTPLNGALTPERVVAFARCSLDEVKRTKAAFGVTVNDVMLAASTTALREELLARDALPDRPLVAMVPVSERADSESGAETEFSNRTSALSVALPVQIEDPVERLMALHELALDAKDLHRAMGDGVLEEWTSIVPPFVVSGAVRAITLSGVARLLPFMGNVIVSNVPGPPIPLFLAGARVTHLYPMGPLFEGCGINVTLMSHGDVIDVGVIACPTMVDDPARLTAGFTAGLAELAGAAERVSRGEAPRTEGAPR